MADRNVDPKTLSSLRHRNLDANSDLGKVPRSQTLTVTVKEIPDWQREGLVIRGYRRVQNHWKGCFTSIYSYVHNETVNIHSHLWGAILFMLLLAKFNSRQSPDMT